MDTSPFGKVVAIILTAVLIFLFPLPYVAKAVRETVDDLVNVYVAEFSDTARQQGVITKEMYENLTRSLNRTGELYDINLEVLHPVSGTEIAEIELGDDIPALSTETVSYSESTLNKVAGADDEIQSFATHTHTNDCYAGHRHNSSCTYTYTMPAEGVSANMLRGDLTRYSYLQLVDARSNPWRITELRHDYNTNIFSVKENVGSAVNFYAEFRLGEPLYYNNLNQLYKALQWIEAGSGQSLQLDRNTGFFIYPGWLPALSFSSCTLSQDEMSICKQVVTSMAATSPTQTVKQGDSIVTTAMATYLDGSTGVVNCNSNFNTNQVGTQTVTLTYNGLVGDAKTTGTRTCTITVSVTPKHTHTNNCYAGHRHSDALCYDTLNFGRQMWYWKGNDTRYQFSVEEYNYPGNSYGKNIKMTCGNCGRGYNLVRYVVMTNGSNLSFVQLDQIYFITNTDTLFYRFSVNSDLPNYNSAKVSFDSIVTSITNGESSEGIKEKLRQLDYIPNVACYYCGGQNSISPAIQYVNHGVTFYACDKSTQDTTPICNQVVTSITAKKTVQTVSTKGEFVSTANATYLDEHTGVVNCSNNLNINVVGEQTVTLTYSGLVGNAKTTGTRTCTVNTTVKGLIELTDITVSPLNQDVTRYQNPTFIVTAKYNNNTSKQVTGFSINGYNSTLLGEQTVTLSYKEADITKTATANVTVKNLTTTCPNCNKVYYLDENDID